MKLGWNIWSAEDILVGIGLIILLFVKGKENQ
jgi:hypothetical protein